MTREVKFDKYGTIIPKGEVKVVEATVEHMEKLSGQYAAVVIFEDEAGVRFKIRGYGGGPVAAEMKPIEWPEDVHATYTFRCTKETYQPHYTAEGNSKQEALNSICTERRWYTPEDFVLIDVTAPGKVKSS